MTLPANKDPANVGPSPQETRPTQRALPQFYRSATVLSARIHADLRLKQPRTYDFAADAMSVPLNIDEFARAALSYPIVFAPGAGGPTAHAVVGLQANRNVFVDSAGHWDPDCYVPAYARRYPFILARGQDDSQFILCADLESGFFSQHTGRPLFNDAKATGPAKEAFQFCLAYNRGTTATGGVMKKLIEHDLLVARQGRFSLTTGEDLHPPNFLTIDTARLNSLTDASYLDLRRSGCLPTIHAQLLSQNNWSRLLERTSRPTGQG